MARLPRLVVPHQPHYISQHGHDGQPVFRDSEDYAAYLGWLRERSDSLLPGMLMHFLYNGTLVAMPFVLGQ